MDLRHAYGAAKKADRENARVVLAHRLLTLVEPDLDPRHPIVLRIGLSPHDDRHKLKSHRKRKVVSRSPWSVATRDANGAPQVVQGANKVQDQRVDLDRQPEGRAGRVRPHLVGPRVQELLDSPPLPASPRHALDMPSAGRPEPTAT